MVAKSVFPAGLLSFCKLLLQTSESYVLCLLVNTHEKDKYTANRKDFCASCRGAGNATVGSPNSRALVTAAVDQAVCLEGGCH